MEVNIFFCLFSVLAVAGCVIVLWRISTAQKSEYDNLLKSYRQLEALNLELRAQRHDYLNQLHVIAGLAEIEEYGELQKYVRPLLEQQERTGKAIRTHSAAVNALFAAKLNEAEKDGIVFYLDVSSALNNLPLPDWDLVRILSNLIDNAMTAAKEQASHGGSEKAEVRVKISEDRQHFLFEVENNGAVIEPEMQEKIFEAGYTTKKGVGHGMGLYITRQLVKEYRGTLKCSSEDGRTLFQVAFDMTEPAETEKTKIKRNQ